MKKIQIENSDIIRHQISRRGGGVEISLERWNIEGKMTAYQNYLGGGLLGRVCSDCNVPNWQNNKKLLNISEALKQWFHNQTNPDGEWEGMSYDKNQNMPVSGY